MGTPERTTLLVEGCGCNGDCNDNCGPNCSCAAAAKARTVSCHLTSLSSFVCHVHGFDTFDLCRMELNSKFSRRVLGCNT